MTEVKLPDQMVRCMAAAAEAERAQRSRIIGAEAERNALIIGAQAEAQAAMALANAANTLGTPQALQIRYLRSLQTAAERGNASVIILPLPSGMLTGDGASSSGIITAATTAALAMHHNKKT